MGFFDFLFKSKSKPSPKQEVKSYVLREGQSIEADAVFAAWTSGDLEEMLSAIEVKTNHVDRHFLLQSIVDNTYKLRKDGEKRKICKKIAEVHIAEFPLIASALEKDMNMLQGAGVIRADILHARDVEPAARAQGVGPDQPASGAGQGQQQGRGDQENDRPCSM